MKLLLFLAFIATSQISSAQLNIDVMSYNVLNFPNGSSTRIDSLKKILSYYTPDLFLVQELKSSTGLELIVDALNELSNDYYVSGTYVPQQSNTSAFWKLQQNLVYNTSVFSLAEERVIMTTYRDVNYFKLYLNDENIATTVDTAFIHVYVTHFKSSQGSSNELLRYEMAQTMRADINSLPANSYVICGGDFNLYTSTEQAYQHLIDNSVTNTLVDPINQPGDWTNSSYPNKEILTQSTRLIPLSDGAGGGLDDRFDFVLHSTEMNAGNAELDYVDNTYKAMGNNGTCYNQDLINCTTVGNVPDSILSALYNFSDHLPIIYTLSSDVVLGLSKNLGDQIRIYPNPTSTILTIQSGTNENLRFEVIDLTGKSVLRGELTNTIKVDLSSIENGTYLIRIMDNQRMIKREKLVKI